MSDQPFGPFPSWMLGNAEWQVKQHQYAAGILLAQVAVEMAARDAFTGLVAGRFGTPVDPALLRLVPDFSFMATRTRAFWRLLTGNPITDPPDVWEPYRQHVRRRNRIAHGQEWGDAEGSQGARDSVAAASAFMDRMAADL